MTTFTVHLTDGRQAEVTADEVRVTDTGVLVLSRAGAPLTPLLVLNSRQWQSCHSQDAPVLVHEQPVPAKPEPPKREPYVMPAMPAP